MLRSACLRALTTTKCVPSAQQTNHTATLTRVQGASGEGGAELAAKLEAMQRQLDRLEALLAAQGGIKLPAASATS